MAGTLEGGRKAAITNKQRHGEDFYVKNGRLSQKAWEANGRKPRGFAARPDLASSAGTKGGKNRWRS